MSVIMHDWQNLQGRPHLIAKKEIATVQVNRILSEAIKEE